MEQHIMAHRGASGYAPENTLEAFELAVRMGAYGVELDVHLTKDGEIVVAHDETVERVSEGSGRIADMTLAALQQDLPGICECAHPYSRRGVRTSRPGGSVYQYRA